MAKIEKILCDKCKRELEYDECYYCGNIFSTRARLDKGRLILNGDYCEECFKEIIKKEIGG